MDKKKGFLLSYIKYGENDGIIHCFTADLGFESFYIRGIYSTKNKKKAYLYPLAELYLEVNAKTKSRQLPTLNKIEMATSHRADYHAKTSSILFFISDFLHQILKAEQSSPPIYKEIKLFLKELERENYQAHFIFLFKMIKHLGFAPLINEAKFLDAETGSFGENPTHHFFTAEISELWKKVLQDPDPYKIHIPQKKSRELLNSLLLYFQFHFENFKTPISLEIVKEIFQ